MKMKTTQFDNANVAMQAASTRTARVHEDAVPAGACQVACQERGIRGGWASRGEQGMTLVEIMIVVVIMALIATGVGVTVIPKILTAKQETTRTRAATIESAAEMWMAEQVRGGCPSVDDLVETKNLKSTGDRTDGWGNDFQINCEGGEIFVRSAGEDGEFGTEDDLP